MAGMSTQAIADKMREFVPGFDVNSFLNDAQKYFSSEDLSEGDYYPRATFSDADEDFIWMACEELWKRLIPDRPSVEYVADQIDNLVEKMDKAVKAERREEVLLLSREGLDLIWRHITEENAGGRRLRRDFYDKLRKATFYDFAYLLEEMLLNLMRQREWERVIDIAEVLGDVAGDDILLGCKAESLFAMGRQDESERLYQHIIDRNPDDPWYLVHAGDCYAIYHEKDLGRARDYYLKALGVAEKHLADPEGIDDLRDVYQRLISLAYEAGSPAEAGRYQRLLDSMEAKQAKKAGRNDPCPCGSGKKYKKCCGKPSQDPPIRDARLMERNLRAMSQFVKGRGLKSVDEMNKAFAEFNARGKSPEWVPETPLDRAQELVYQALETNDRKERIRLAKRALQVSQDCADAYVILAEEAAESLEQARDWYQRGVEVGERALGENVFNNDVGHFWGAVETRPYMRARAGLADCLWGLGMQDAAVGHYREMLRLNPNDNQGMRYRLLNCFIERKDIVAARGLLGEYPNEITADWLFSRALVTFLQEGDSVDARQDLQEAIKQNPHVAAFLLDHSRMPHLIPDRVGIGDSDEAAAYVADFGHNWRDNPPALAWLRSTANRGTDDSTPPPFAS